MDIFYTDPFIRPIEEVDGIRLASVEEIIAMKVDVILRGGRKMDFWDIHELMENYSFEEMFALHKERHPAQSSSYYCKLFDIRRSRRRL